MTSRNGITAEWLAERRAAAKSFVRMWHNNGLTFEQLVAEGFEPNFLRSIFREAGLPTENNATMMAPTDQSRSVGSFASVLPRSEHRPTAKDRNVNISKTVPPEPTTFHQISTGLLPAPSTTLPPKPPTPVSQSEKAPSAVLPPKITKPTREEYLARLQAAKTQKPAGATSNEALAPPSTLQQGTKAMTGSGVPLSSLTADSARTSSSVLPVPGAIGHQTTASPIHSGVPSAEAIAEAKRRAQTALARERIEALARKQAAKRQSDPATTSASAANLILSEVSDTPTGSTQESSRESVTLSGHILLPAESLHQMPAAGSSAPSTPAQAVPPGSSQSPFQAGRIPGLFMMAPVPAKRSSPQPEATVASPQPGETQQSATSSSSRKRPVAADFMSDTWKPVKRPFGQPTGSRANEAIIIEASDEEDLPSPKEAQSRHQSNTLNTGDPPMTPTSKSTSSDGKGLRPSLGTPSRSGNIQTVARQMEILAMKKKIAEMELKRRLAKVSKSNAMKTSRDPYTARKQNAGASTKLRLASDGAGKVSNVGVSDDSLLSDVTSTAVAETNHSSKRISSPPITSQTERAASSLPVVTSETSPTSATVAIPSSLSDWRTRRRTELQQNIPALEANLASHAAKMEALRAQMKELEDSMQREEDDKKKLIDELEALGVDTEGMAHSELQEAKDEMIAQANAANDQGEWSKDCQAALS